MDTVSKLPFHLTVSDTHYHTRYCHYFLEDIYQIYRSDKVTVEIEENEETWIFFDSKDEDARLYLEALDAIPEKYGVRVDEQDKLYKSPSKQSFPLYRNNGEFDALCVDKYMIRVSCFGKDYFGILSIKPKQLEQAEWVMMKNDLEQEMKDLGKQALRKNTNMEFANIVSEQEWYTFDLLHRRKEWLLSVLQDIMEHPKYKIVTKYMPMVSRKFTKNNRKTIQYMIQNGENSRKLLLCKETSYNISENQFLKIVLKQCKKIIKEMLEKLSVLLADEQEYWDKEKITTYYRSGKAIFQFITCLESEKWYQQIDEQMPRQLSRAIFMDDRYGYLYKVYQSLLHPETVELDLLVNTSIWKPSSLLYEMWCYIKLCRRFEEQWSKLSSELSHCFRYENGMPILQEGSYMEYTRGEIRVKLYYNPMLPRTSQATSKEQPYYMLNSHVQPDMVLHIYEDKTDVYLGSLVLECKYRKVNSFWNGSTMSSREQITSYWNGSKSHYFFGKIGELLDVRPVKCVYVLAPECSFEEKMDGKIQLVSIRPGKNASVEELYENIEEKIQESMEVYQKVRSMS